MKIKSIASWGYIVCILFSMFFAYVITEAAKFSQRMDCASIHGECDLVFIAITFLFWFLVASIILCFIFKIIRLAFKVVFKIRLYN